MSPTNSNHLTPSAHVDEADWYTSGLAGFGGRVECVIPRGFAAYARILHPARATVHRATWAEVAEFSGTTLHPLAQFHALARWRAGSTGSMSPAGTAEGPAWIGTFPNCGTLDVASLTALVDVLADFTPSIPVWLTVWEGWGNLPVQWRSLRKIEQPGRSYYLFEGSLATLVDFSRAIAQIDATPSPTQVQSPSQWWPAGQSWCVASEIDFDSTLVGGTAELIDALTSNGLIEAFPVELGDDLTVHGDRVNVAD